ncbi:uncharacterized protein DMAD_07544 [Drosophila madeirensis]|uniref:Secreted protein n=1 Tax=Drosophila madeirensis TaxID=30013 RepID=A0AAU9FVR6_DROMD
MMIVIVEIVMIVVLVVIEIVVLVAAEVIVVMVVCAVHLVGLSLEEVAHFLDEIRIGRDMEIDQRLHHLLPVVRLGHLHGNQRIDIDQTQIEAIRAQGAKVGILRGILIAQDIHRVAAICPTGVGQAKGHAVGGQNFPLDQLDGLQGGQGQGGLPER